ncbi:hypothetical protein [Demequina sp. NBRC 110053]|uniref:hypothetical protein n=1 Tax=Demequina sp. NBRC 110053 TaxID=1570342 RepID=UPI0013565533|nr:hypothetical protein [Demequina sp. NBRC 110053]
MAELIRATPPARISAVIGSGLPWIAGYVVRAQDVSESPTAGALYADLGLGFPGSPYGAQREFVDVLRVPAQWTLQLATPGEGENAATPPLRDHPPFGQTGFIDSSKAFVPYWWLAPSPVPAGTTLWRIGADGSANTIAAYGHVGVGWLACAPAARIAHTPIRFTEVLGMWAQYRGERVLADILPDGTAVIAVPDQREGWQPSPRGVFWTEVYRADLDRVWVSRTLATWRDQEFQVVGLEGDEAGRTAHLVYSGHDAGVAGSLGLTETDASVYEALAPISELHNVREAQTDLPG